MMTHSEQAFITHLQSHRYLYSMAHAKGMVFTRIASNVPLHITTCNGTAGQQTKRKPVSLYAMEEIASAMDVGERNCTVCL